MKQLVRCGYDGQLNIDHRLRSSILATAFLPPSETIPVGFGTLRRKKR